MITFKIDDIIRRIQKISLHRSLVNCGKLILMMFSITKYERKYHDKKRWEDISEIELLGDLSESKEGVTPAIKLLIEGKHVLTPKAVYRLKLDE